MELEKGGKGRNSHGLLKTKRVLQNLENLSDEMRGNENVFEHLGGNSIAFFDSPKLGDQAQSWVTSPLSLLRLGTDRRRRERGGGTQL